MDRPEDAREVALVREPGVEGDLGEWCRRAGERAGRCTRIDREAPAGGEGHLECAAQEQRDGGCRVHMRRVRGECRVAALRVLAAPRTHVPHK